MEKFTTYKALAALSTVCLLVITGTQVSRVFQKANPAESQLDKTIFDIKNTRDKALKEIEAVRKESLNSLKNIPENNSSTYWLVLKGKISQYAGYSWQIPVGSKKECETTKDLALTKVQWDGAGPNALSGICLKGK